MSKVHTAHGRRLPFSILLHILFLYCRLCRYYHFESISAANASPAQQFNHSVHVTDLSSFQFHPVPRTIEKRASDQPNPLMKTMVSS